MKFFIDIWDILQQDQYSNGLDDKILSDVFQKLLTSYVYSYNFTPKFDL